MNQILNILYKPKTEFIICVDININYMERNNHRITFDNLLSIYNLANTVNFPTRFAEKTTTMIDNIFIDAQRTFNISPHINGLSDHDAQILTINNFPVPNIKYAPQYTRIINKINIAELQLQLSWESWNEVFNKKDVNLMFNSFLNTYLRYFNSSFKIKKKKIPMQQ